MAASLQTERKKEKVQNSIGISSVFLVFFCGDGGGEVEGCVCVWGGGGGGGGGGLSNTHKLMHDDVVV